MKELFKNLVVHDFKAPSSALLISRYILRLGQAAQKQQRPRCPDRKMYLEIRKADEWLFKLLLTYFMFRLISYEHCALIVQIFNEIRIFEILHRSKFIFW